MGQKLIPETLKIRIEELPKKSGVYLFKNRERQTIYIGKALSIQKRVKGHFRFYGESFSKEGKMLSDTVAIDLIETPDEAEALLLEASLVKESLPKYNKELRDDKSYPFLKITAEEYPRLVITRSRKPDGGKYFGPYTDVRLLRQAVRMLRREFPMRTCKTLPKKVCLMYHIGQCKAPCVGYIQKAEYDAMARDLEKFLMGRRDVLVKSLLRRMKEHSAKKEYEKAKTLYEEIQALRSVPNKSEMKDASLVLEALKNGLELPKIPLRIEGFDISNIMGREAVGSMVVMIEGKPARSEYRRFKIRTVKGIDDYRMMKEVVRRRYARVLAEGSALPDLVVIDGGKGHLAAVKSILDELGLPELPIISIAKEHEYLFKPGREKPTIFPQSSPILHLIQNLRDEAHRFAITYHRLLHRKGMIPKKPVR
ncbi:MAG: excinuclease ABC subunit UvrC [Candidatus Omnitrophica bacterium]|nr:excinuclease ABC subunit UvrC [Candidatus Omnitrophota bacterium]